MKQVRHFRFVRTKKGLRKVLVNPNVKRKVRRKRSRSKIIIIPEDVMDRLKEDKEFVRIQDERRKEAGFPKVRRKRSSPGLSPEFSRFIKESRERHKRGL